MTLLIIDRVESMCDACGVNCDPHEKSHKTNLGWSPEVRAQPGCGAVYTQVTSNYIGMDDVIKAMRPDLEWVSQFDRIPREL
jgi:hypothetical protein